LEARAKKKSRAIQDNHVLHILNVPLAVVLYFAHRSHHFVLIIEKNHRIERERREAVHA